MKAKPSLLLPPHGSMLQHANSFNSLERPAVIPIRAIRKIRVRKKILKFANS